LLILRGRQNDDASPSVSASTDNFFALEELLDHDLSAGIAEGTSEHRARATAAASARVLHTTAPLPAASPGRFHDERLGMAAIVVELPASHRRRCRSPPWEHGRVA